MPAPSMTAPSAVIPTQWTPIGGGLTLTPWGGLWQPNPQMWPYGCMAKSGGPADLCLLGDDYFAETLPDGGFQLTKA